MVESLTSQSPQAGQFNSYSPTIEFSVQEIPVSIPSSGSIQFLPWVNWVEENSVNDSSQSPQAGQFNSYKSIVKYGMLKPGKVSIPSSGSIQFLLKSAAELVALAESLSQSPQAGQFNSYRSLLDLVNLQIEMVSIPSSGSIQFLQWIWRWTMKTFKSQSPQAGQFNSYNNPKPKPKGK